MNVLKKAMACGILLASLCLPVGQAAAPTSIVASSAADATLSTDFSTPAERALDGGVRYVFPSKGAEDAVKGIEIQLSAQEMIKGHSTPSYARPLYLFDPLELGLLEQEI
ncbi:hypothetical protein [Saccharibacillus sacchari]|uniref:Uncharacterized protein n=1 Tax=Saccharibacillus sacchari TaxID=456493 RepID=A0ACC6PHK7_9BACL